MIMRWIAWSTIGISLLLYVLACALPSGVVVGIDPEDEVRGIWCLVGGWTAVFFPKEALLKSLMPLSLFSCGAPTFSTFGLSLTRFVLR